VTDTTPTKQIHSLRNHFLIAMPSLEDSIFSQSVTYVCDHNEHGAMGVIINQPSELRLSSIFEQLDLPQSSRHNENLNILTGGPVNPEQGLVLHKEKGDWESTLSISNDLHITTSKDIIEALAREGGPENPQLAFGYAGWGEGQLEEELSNNLWLTMPADPAILFDVPAEARWEAVEQRLGVDLSLLSTQVGHA